MMHAVEVARTQLMTLDPDKLLVELPVLIITYIHVEFLYTAPGVQTEKKII